MTGSVPVHATERLARRALSVRAGDLDAETRAVARHVVVDALACAAAGRRTEAARVVRDTAAGLFGGGDSPVWYQGLRLSPAGAAYANAAATAALDLDDGNRAAGGHPGPAIVPAVLAEAQAIDAPGTAVLAALVAGYDVAVRMGRGEIHRAYASGNWTGFGVVAALAHLRGLDAATLAHALAIHAYHGPHVTDLTDSVEMGAHVKEVIPWSVAAAFGSVALAQNGYTGARDAIDVGRRTDPAPTLRDLDGRHLILDTYFKRYSVCRWAHAAIDGLLGLMATHGFTGDAIRGLKVETFQRAILLHNSPRPPSLEAAQYSVRFCLALAALRGPGALLPLTGDRLDDAPVHALAERVEMVFDPEIEALFPLQSPARVTAVTDGGTFTARVDYPWGDPGHYTGDDLAAKARVLAGDAAAARILAFADALADGGPVRCPV